MGLDGVAQGRASDAWDLLQKTKRELEALGEALNRMWEAVALMSRDGRVVYANRAAANIFERAAGVSLTQDDRLIAATSDARERVSQALKQCVCPAPIAVQRSHQAPLVLQVQPLSPNLQGTFGAVALMFINDPEARPNDRTAALRSAYRLTDTEARLVQSLSEGASLKKIAETNRISYQTVRTHVRRILSKTGAKRQAELVRIAHALR